MIRPDHQQHTDLMDEVRDFVSQHGGYLYNLGIEHLDPNRVDITPLRNVATTAVMHIRTRRDSVAVFPNASVLIDAKTTNNREYGEGDFLIELLPFVSAISLTSIYVPFLFACRWGEREFAIHDLPAAAASVSGVLFPRFRQVEGFERACRQAYQRLIPNADWIPCGGRGSKSGDPFVRLPLEFCETCPDLWQTLGEYATRTQLTWTK